MVQKKPVRRSQLLSPWGVGAIVPFPNDESLMIAGLDMWNFGDDPTEFIIKDERLQNKLNVKELRLPPDYKDSKTTNINRGIKIPAVRFPLWHYCPFCGTMEKLTLLSKNHRCSGYNWPHGRKCVSGKGKKLIPERFIVVCPHGHVDDFPIMEWVHRGSNYSDSCKLRRSTGGTSAALTGVFYECSCGAKRSMAGSMNEGALEKIGYTCKGSMPWLGKIDNESCHSTKVKVVQRGGSNVWFPDVFSSLYIPVENLESRKYLIRTALECEDFVKNRLSDGKIDSRIVEPIAMAKKVDFNEFLEVLTKIIEKSFEDKNNIESSEDSYRYTEYQALVKSSGSDSQDFHSKNLKITEYSVILHDFINSISLVPKVKETRAFYGFSRLQPDDALSLEEKKKMLRLSNNSSTWLPAIQVHGEGIFFEFSKSKLDEWKNREEVKNRIKLFNNNLSKKLRSDNKEIKNINPIYILLHTFSHILINQLSYESGYGSSSIRERIYCNKFDEQHQMYGIFLYTASGDSEGSLGGLVRQGKPGNLEKIILNGLENAEWCSADPVCIQSSGQGIDNLNLAACHNCSLLPETCCENGNRYLDRALLIGTIEEKNIGYFIKDGELL